jgi:hypothetical protein
MTTSFHFQHLYTETETETINVIGCKWKNIIIGLMDVPRLTDTCTCIIFVLRDVKVAIYIILSSTTENAWI